MRRLLPWRPACAADGLLPLASVLDALGRNGDMGRWHGDVPVSAIIGSDQRPFDFDADFRLCNPALADRWERLATAVRSGRALPPVDLVLVGEIYFVRDGHHRVSVARSMGWPVIPARVQQICTVAFAMACLRAVHLCAKAAERRFLERVPLPDELRAGLWLDHPEQWMRLGDAAEAWGFRQLLDGRRLGGRRELAEAWWSEEVAPAVAGLRAVADTPPARRDVEVYVAALADRDRVAGVPSGA